MELISHGTHDAPIVNASQCSIDLSQFAVDLKLSRFRRNVTAFSVRCPESSGPSHQTQGTGPAGRHRCSHAGRRSGPPPAAREARPRRPIACAAPGPHIPTPAGGRRRTARTPAAPPRRPARRKRAVVGSFRLSGLACARWWARPPSSSAAVQQGGSGHRPTRRSSVALRSARMRTLAQGYCSPQGPRRGRRSRRHAVAHRPMGCCRRPRAWFRLWLARAGARGAEMRPPERPRTNPVSRQVGAPRRRR